MVCVYYLDVMSQWCMFADRAVAQLLAKYRDELQVDYRIAPVKEGEPLGYNRTALQWMYRRSESISGIATVATWIEDEHTSSFAINAACLAAIHLGADVMTVREAIQQAALHEGRLLGRKDEAIAVVATAAGLDATTLRQRSEQPDIAAEMRKNVADLRTHGADLRPTFVMESPIGDRIVLSGTWRFEVLDPCVGSLLADAKAYADFEKANPPPI